MAWFFEETGIFVFPTNTKAVGVFSLERERHLRDDPSLVWIDPGAVRRPPCIRGNQKCQRWHLRSRYHGFHSR